MIRRRFGQGLRRKRRHTVLGTAFVVGCTALAVAVAVPTAGAVTNHPPVGWLRSVAQSPDGIAVYGWAYDPDSTTVALTVRLTVDGTTVRTMTANLYGTGLAAYGSYHFFRADLPQPAGTHTVCAYALDAQSRVSTRVACQTITVDFSPTGSLNFVTQVASGTMRVRGWTFDPNMPTESLSTHITVDGTTVANPVANVYRGDVARAYPSAGAMHGVDLQLRISEGKHTICFNADNIGLGANRTIGCKVVTFNFSPVGAISSIAQRAGGFALTGWAADPDTATPISVQVRANSIALGTFIANGSANNGHGLSVTVHFAGPTAPGSQQICLYGYNAAGTYGTSRTVACAAHSFNFNPQAGIDAVAQHSPGVQVSGWATDPNTTAPSKVQVLVDGTVRSTVTANAATGSRPGHGFTTVVAAPNGKHTVCVIALKSTIYSTANSAPRCATVTLNFNPFGAFESAARVGTTSTFSVKGWAIDPDTSNPISVRIAIDGVVVQTVPANLTRTDIATRYPYGALHGFAANVPSDQNEHKVCVTAVNVAGGTGDTSLGCKIVIAAHPVPPSPPQQVSATAGYGGAVISWTPPASDGGAPWSGYTITSVPGGVTLHAGANDTSTTLLGLKPSTTYTFTVTATNVAGTSAAGTSNATTTLASPPPQTTPAPISTSRYVRNITGTTSTDTAKMYAEGATDAYYNPSGHGYLVLLDIGGQDEMRGGVILSASVRFVTYGALVKSIEAYVDGYASKQRPSAPITIAIGTNNDVDVSKTAGVNWANKVVDPVVAYARKYPNIVIAGANDIEPGFSATYTQTQAWLQGYLSASTAPFVFNGSADGCSWTTTGQRCNNGWTMGGLYSLAGGAAPTRIVNLPQIYNTTMAKQWRYISLTGVNAGKPRINFGGALTEWTACQQDGGCGSLTGNYAWTTMWTQLRAEPKLWINSLPYSTDLRIDR